jgi:hypothetical protein
MDNMSFRTRDLAKAILLIVGILVFALLVVAFVIGILFSAIAAALEL